MKLLSILSLVLLAVAKAPEPVAIVYSLTGAATLASPARPLHRLDRLQAGATIEVGPASHLALYFASGVRYELGEGSRVVIGKTDLASRAGLVKALPRVPPFPILVAISESEKPGAKAGAVRIRAETIPGLSPDGEVISLASAIRLRFDPTPAAPLYRVRILGRRGETLFQVDTRAAEVGVPSGVLSPGRTYRWTVETRDRPGPVARGEATLRTLDADRSRAREELRRWQRRSGAAADLELLEAVDQALGLVAESRCPFSAPGLVVETVTPESAAFRAGLAPGDRLHSWTRVEEGSRVARGELRTPFDWLDVQMGDVQRGGVAVEGARGAETRRWNLLPTVQGLTVAPLLQGALAEAYQAASSGDELERAAGLADRSHCVDEALWLRFRAAQLRAKARQWPESDVGFQTVLVAAQSLGAANVESHLLMAWSEALVQRSDFARARQQLEKSLELEEKQPERLGVEAVLLRLGNVLERQDSLDEADRLYRKAHDLITCTVPGGGAEAAAALNLAVVTGRKGDLAEAELYAARALAIRETLTPAGDAIIPSLLSYGNVLYARGDFAGAEASFLRAKRILENVQPTGVPMALVLHNLGELAHERGDDEEAESLFRRELALFEQVEPDGSRVRDSLVGLGEVALRQGDGVKAEELWRRARAISEKLNPNGPKSARCLYGLAGAARLRGRPAEAGTLLRQALAIWQEINPEAADAGFIHLNLGLLLFDQGKAGAAEIHFRTAIRIYENDGRPLPKAYQALARLQAAQGQGEAAAASYLSAVGALEAQRVRLGGAQESRWFYGSALGDLFFEAAEHQIALGRPQEAWQLVERGRARGFQELLAQRDVRFAADIPAELYVERRRLAAEYDQVQEALADWVPARGTDTIEALQGRLRDLRREQAEVQERIRLSSPRLAALEKPAPLDLAATRAALDPGTVLLTYAAGTSRTYLFVIRAEGAPGPGLSFHPLAIGKGELTQEIEAFRSLLVRPDTDLAALKQRGRRLYDLLIRPASPVIGRAERWLISPDGPLHSLPFAALLSGDRYLAESMPVHTIASAAVYREIRAARPGKPSSATTELLALGDPLYPVGAGQESADPQVQRVLRRGVKLESLPATRNEVKAISGLFPGARLLLGGDATEEAVKALAPQVRRLHLACHGLLDERFPLNSGLALSLPERPGEGGDNGLLQAWEVFEGLRLDADLVTLSACDTGLGKEMGGEGLVGLVRAFQFAGARSVLASLWSVSDDSTADLMQRFYGYLRKGLAKDEALRKAQADLIHRQDFAHPYHWAAFQLTGDWQ